MAKGDEKPKEQASTPQQAASATQQGADASQATQDGTSQEATQTVSQEEFDKLKSELGRFKQELGDARKAAEEGKAYKMAYEQQQQQQRQQPPTQQEPPNYDEEFFDSPTKAINKILQQYDIQRSYRESFQAAPSALQQAKMMFPGRFEGVDDQMISQIMYGGVQQGQMNPAVLRDPNMWAGAAWVAKGYQTGYKVPEQPLGGMPPSETETPSMPKQVSNDKEIPDIQGDDLTNQFIDELMKLGITKEQALEEIQKTREQNRGR